VALSIQIRRVGEVVVVACRGRLAGASETSDLQRAIDQLLPLEPQIVLDAAEMAFVDSAGVGLLVRLLHRARRVSGDLKLCRLAPRVAEMLRITRLTSVFDVHAREDAAIAAFYTSQPAGTGEPRGGDILFVDDSPDLVAYVCGVLRAAGYRVLPCGNVADAAVLLKVSSPRAVIVGAGARARLETVWPGGAAKAVALLELPPGFDHRDPSESSRELLTLAHALIGEPA
jgi:anti-sigma B factor antagonist